jgi:hypothetical protein
MEADVWISVDQDMMQWIAASVLVSSKGVPSSARIRSDDYPAGLRLYEIN